MSAQPPPRLDVALKLFAILPWALILTCPIAALLAAILSGGLIEARPKQTW